MNTPVIRLLRPEFKFPAKIEMAFSQTLEYKQGKFLKLNTLITSHSLHFESIKFLAKIEMAFSQMLAII